jgi:hypothetical protein
MKKHIYITILSAFVVLGSCSDQLERLPVDSLVEATAYQSVSDLEAGVTGALGALNFNSTIAFSAIFTDNAKKGKDNGGQEVEILKQVLNPQGGDYGTWTNRYNTINNFNRVLAGAANVTPGSGEQVRYNNVLGQAYAFRAYMHFELLSFYGLDFMDPAAMAIPYQNSVSTSDLPARLTTAEVLVLLEGDLANAANLITSTDVNLATVDFVNFLRARIALYSGNYNGAIGFANGLITKYPLANRIQYTGMFNGDTDVTEVVFKFDNVSGYNRNIANNFIFTGTGGAFIEMSNSLFNVLDPTDIRTSILLEPATSDPANNVHDIGKYPPGADTNYINDFKAMRISEMYLIRAEAFARKAIPNLASAAADVQALRNARYNTPPATSYGNLIDAITDIKLERRIELAFEGHRYIDIKRYRSILNEGIERDAIDCAVDGYPCSLPVSSERFIFPIPQAEVLANPNMTQAPNY